MWTDNLLSERVWTNPVTRYAAPTVLTLTALVACQSLTGFVGLTTLYILLFPVIVYSALCCGVGPSDSRGRSRSGGSQILVHSYRSLTSRF